MKQSKKIIEKKDATKKIKTIKAEESNEVVKLVRIGLIVLVIFLVFVGITYLISNSDKNKTEKKEVTIQYEEILIGNIWSLEDENYILVGNEEDSYLSLYNTYINVFMDNNKTYNYYTINLDNVFNKNYVSENSNVITQNHADIRFNGATLIKVVNKEIKEAYVGHDNIMSHLKEVTKDYKPTK